LFLLVSAAVGQYCPSGPGSSLDTNLGPVTIVGDGTSSIQDGTDCPKTIGPRDLTSLFSNISAGKTYTITFQITACSGYVYEHVIGAWIDYNKNGIFESNENLFFQKGTTGLFYSKPFTVPTPLDYRGPTRLRLQVQETSYDTIDPCSQFYYGATKDYTVNLGSPNLYCNCGPTSDQDTNLGPTIFLGEKLDIIQYASACPGNFGPRNFTEMRADVSIDKSYSFVMTVVTCNKQFPNIISSAWIDWNGNQDFEEWERVLAPTARFGAIFVQVTVPSNAVPGPTSMRTMVQEMMGGGNTIGPCDNFQYGATYDYPISINAGP